MHRTLLSRRWLGFLVLCLVLAALCVRLGFWQLSRFEGHRAANARVAHNLHIAPVPLDQLARVGGHVTDTDEWRRVTATGHYDVDHQLLVRQRPLDGANGYEVLTPLVTAQGSAVIVDRGWIAAGISATTSPSVPAPPAGEVTVTGRLRPSESGPLHQEGLPAGQVRRIAVDQIAADLPYPVYGGYAQLVAERPSAAQPLSPLPADEQATALNLAYTVQWWLFAIVAVVGWFFLARREALDASTDSPRDVQRSSADLTG